MKFISKQRKTAAAICAFLSIFGCAAAGNLYLPAHVEAAGYTVQEKNPVNLMPINRAKFLKGQRFDLQVEVKGVANNFKVTVDGVDAEKYFGKTGTVKTADGVTVYCIPDVAFTKAGDVKVEAVADGKKNVANYTVTDAKAKKKAKNVILFVGDGMSLQAREMARILSKGLSDGKYNDLLNMEKWTTWQLLPPPVMILS